MIKKLLLIRAKDINSQLLDQVVLKDGTPIRQYVSPSMQDIPVSPAAWHESVGLSHYGFVLEMKLKQWQEVEAWNKNKATTPSLLLDLSKEGVDATLASVGLKVNQEA